MFQKVEVQWFGVKEVSPRSKNLFFELYDDYLLAFFTFYRKRGQAQVFCMHGGKHGQNAPIRFILGHQTALWSCFRISYTIYEIMIIYIHLTTFITMIIEIIEASATIQAKL